MQHDETREQCDYTIVYSKRLRGYIMCSHGSYVVGLVCVSALVLIYKHRPVLKQAQGMGEEILSNRTKEFHFPLNWIVPKPLTVSQSCAHI